ncbi:MAG: right-handed parallel beta-helix repeat-containing protein, partial [Candidatus Poseidoniaceae archaeon]
MDIKSRTPFGIWFVLFLLLVTPFAGLSPFAFDSDEPIVELTPQSVGDSVNARAQTTWSGTVSVTSTYTVSVFDELIISPCTNIEMGSGARIYIEGRLTIEGTIACPVTLISSTGSDHDGIQFNSSSNNRGSILNNLSIEDSIYGVTMYGANPIIHNLTILNPDRVGIDMFSSSSPLIYDLVINQAGRVLPFQGDWRYGLGLSIGSGSTPLVDGAIFTDHLTRAINIWGGSGGVLRNLVMSNISGSSWAISAGVWVEDSQPLLLNLSVDRSDHGIVVRHIDDSGYTRAVFRDCTVSNSMYRGVYVDKENHSNYTNYETADFTNLTVRGTGGEGAKTPNIAFAAIDVNSTGAWFENTLVDNSTSTGVRLYYADSSTTFRNLTIRDSGDPGQGPHKAGLAITWIFTSAPVFDGLEISGSVGHGIHSYKAEWQGSDLYLHNNSENGMFLDYSSVQIEGSVLENNSLSGLHMLDNIDTQLTNFTVQYNGFGGTTDEEKAGMFFDRSKTVTHPQLDVECFTCTVTHSAGSGILIRDSADLWLSDIVLAENDPNHAPFDVDNSGLTLGQQGGVINIDGLDIHTERSGASGTPAVNISQAAARIHSLTMSGNHSGIEWDGQNHNDYSSEISNSNFSGTGCVSLTNHLDLSGSGNTVSPSCSGTIQLINSQVNWSALTDLALASTVLQLDSNSDLHLHQPVNVDLNQSYPTIASGATVDVAYDITVWVVNNNTNGIPRANVDVSFSQFEPVMQDLTNTLGYLSLPNFIGQRWTNTGSSSYTVATISCGYDSVSNSTTVTIDQDRFVNCVLPLENQAPFLMWATPVDLGVFISQGPVEFNASDSWDLDDDELTFTWTSDLDGDIVASCTGQGQGNGQGITQQDMTNGVPFTVNTNYLNMGCQLSDGIHVITLEVCDDAGHCVSETRTIELVNQPPTIVFDVTPELTPWSELVIPRTQNVLFNLTGTFDPEGDTLICWIERSYQNDGVGQQSGCPTEVWINFSMAETVPSTFNLEIYAYDGINTPPSEYIIPVELYNEVPEPEFTLTRLGNASEDEVTLDGTATIDPEGDTLEIEYWSSLDGQLSWNNTEAGKVWTGYLSRGVHSIEMRVVDNRPEHINATRVTSILVDVENSLPQAVIETPTSTQTYTSAELIWFSANGSGDYDAACSTFPPVGDWHCAEAEPFSGSEYLVIVWSSDLDGRLTPEGEDWLMFDGRLTAGSHVITLSLDDGIHEPVTVSRTVEVLPSAPQLDLASPLDGAAFSSSSLIQWDARQSVDYDGDNFTMTIRSDLLNEPLLSEVSTSQLHSSALPAGEHTIKITLTDETGKEQISFITLTIGQSDPVAVLLQPQNLISITPGES